MAGLFVGCSISTATSLQSDFLPPSAGILAQTAPAMSPVYEGLRLVDMDGFAAMTDIANFTAAPLPVTNVSVTVTGSVADAVTVLTEGDTVGFEVVVTDAGGSSARFVAEPVTVEYAVRATVTATNEIEIDRNPIAVTGTFTLDFTGSDAPYDGIYSIDLAEYVTRPVIFATAPVTGTLAVGDVLGALDGLAVSEGVNGVESRRYQWYRFATGSKTLADRVAIAGATSATYTLTLADGGNTVVRGEIVTDSLGDSAEAFAAGLDVPASGVVLDLFADVDGTALTAHTADSGEAWVDVTSGRTVPVISGGRLSANTTSGGGEYFALTGVSNADVVVTADIDTGAGGSAIGLLARVQGSDATFTAYYGRYNKALDNVQLYVIVNDALILVRESAVLGTVDNTTYKMGLRCVGTQIEIDWSNIPVVSVTNAAVSGAGSVGIGHYRGGSMTWAQFEARNA